MIFTLLVLALVAFVLGLAGVADLLFYLAVAFAIASLVLWAAGRRVP